MSLRIARTLLGFVLCAAPARAEEPAPDKLACVEAHKQAQLQERAGKLLAAREAWAMCVHEACPNLVKNACAQGLAALKVPSIVVTVREKGGGTASGARVTLDGKELDGSKRLGVVEVDPGEHVLGVTLPDGRSSERRFTIAPGERSVPVIAELEAPTTAPARPATAPERPVPVAVYVLGGVSAVGLATFAGFGLAGKSTESCKPSCTASERNTLRQQYLIADIGLVAAVLAGGAAIYLYVSRPERASDERAVVGVRPVPGGAALSIGYEH